MAKKIASKSSEIAVLQAVSAAIVRERNVHRLLEVVIDILERELGMLRGTFTLLEGDELRIQASARMLNAEERALGRYHIGEGITGTVAKTGHGAISLAPVSLAKTTALAHVINMLPRPVRPTTGYA